MQDTPECDMILVAPSHVRPPTSTNAEARLEH